VEPPPGVNVITVGICSSFTQFTRIRDFPSECNKDTGPQYIFSFGSRSAVADAAGVAALIDSRWHGFLPGVLVRAKLLNTADDILEPGIDAFSGHGRVNARRGVTE
jgi:hypothetical protein